MNTESQSKKEFVIDTSKALQKERTLQSMPVECGGEFILPDYMPSVRKVLRIEAVALPPAKYVGGGSVQMSGEVLHTLIYMGEDGEAGATVLPSKYEFSVSKDGDAFGDVTSSVEVEGINYRITAPRKLNIRTRLSAKPYRIENEDINVDIKNASLSELNRLYGSLSCLKTVNLHSTDAEVTDTLSIGNAKENKLLWCGATAAVTDAKAASGGVNIRGEIIAKVLVNSDGNIKMYTKKLPFDEFVEGEVSRGDAVCAAAHVIATEAIKENEGEAELTVSLFIEALADSNEEITVLKDAFSTEYETKNEYKMVKSQKHAKIENCVHTVGASIAAATAGIQENQTVIDTSGRAVLEEVSASNGKITVRGRCELSSLLFGENEYSSATYSVPFSISTDCDTSDDMSIRANVALVMPRVRIEGENLVCDMDISLVLRAIKQVSEDIVCTVECDKTKQKVKINYPLCLIYPNGESIWELAKKYSVSPESLINVNSLDIEKEAYREPRALSSVRSLMLELK